MKNFIIIYRDEKRREQYLTIETNNLNNAIKIFMTEHKDYTLLSIEEVA